jgi:restriction endonuclease S subunit
MAEMEKEHLEELETHVELKEEQLKHLEEENRSLMQRLGLKKPG